MKILNVKVNWAIGWNSRPHMEVLVDKIPDRDSLVYEYRDTMFFAEKDGYVHFLCHNGDDKNHGGYGDSSFFVRMRGGVRKELKGPWSGRSGVTNRLGFVPCLEVSITENPEVFEKGHTYEGGAITEELAREAVAFTGAHLVKVDRHGEIYYEVRNFEGECEVCKGFKEYPQGYGDDHGIKPCRWCGGTGMEKDHEVVCGRRS
jgi:hypothetical protein